MHDNYLFTRYMYYYQKSLEEVEIYISRASKLNKYPEVTVAIYTIGNNTDRYNVMH